MTFYSDLIGLKYRFVQAAGLQFRDLWKLKKSHVCTDMGLNLLTLTSQGQVSGANINNKCEG